MDKIIRELKSISQPDKLGMISSTLIILLSFFGNKIDTFMTFLFGISTFFIFSGMSLNRERREDVFSDGKTRTTITNEYLHFKNYPKPSKIFFWIGGILFVLFLIRVILNFL